MPLSLVVGRRGETLRTIMSVRSKIALLLVLGWAGYVGGAIDIAITAVALWAAIDEQQASISVDVVFRDYLAWLYWVKQLAYHVLPDGFVGRIFGLPALLLFPVRVIVSMLIGKWAFATASRLRKGSTLRMGVSSNA